MIVLIISYKKCRIVNIVAVKSFKLFLCQRVIRVIRRVSLAGIFAVMSVLGPVLAYIGGGSLLKVYTDVDKVDPAT